MRSGNWSRWRARVACTALVVAVIVGGLGLGTASASDRFRPTKVQTDTNTTQLGFGDDAPAEQSSMTFSGFETNVADVEVILHRVSHNGSQDMDVVLQGPGGQTAIVMSDAGAGSTAAPSATLTLNDQASNQLPSNSALTTGEFQPTNFGSGDTLQLGNAQLFIPDSGSALGVFNGTNPNGVWTLYAFDDDGNGTTGFILGGWTLRITSANGAPVARPDSFQAKAGRRLNVPAPGVLANDTDPDSDLLTVVVADRPNKGRLTLRSNGSFTYIPRKDAKGRDSFTYVVRDPSGLTEIGTVNIRIKPAKTNRRNR